MRSPSGYRQILISLLVLALAQFACGQGTQPSTSSPQPASPVAAATLPPPAGAAVHGTPAEARAMLQKAVDHYDAVGRKQALADFTGRTAPFFDRDLYVACIDARLIISANGGFPNLVGSAVEPLSRAAWDAASRGKIDSINYAYTDPVTKQSEPKTLYYEKVGTDVCGVGAYHP